LFIIFDKYKVDFNNFNKLLLLSQGEVIESTSFCEIRLTFK